MSERSGVECEDDDVVFVDDDDWMSHNSPREVAAAIRESFIAELERLVGKLEDADRFDAYEWLPGKILEIGADDVTAERMASLYLKGDE